jgi:hypothetical protein
VAELLFSHRFVVGHVQVVSFKTCKK